MKKNDDESGQPTAAGGPGSSRPAHSKPSNANGGGERSVIDRVLGWFTVVEPGEGATALWLALDVFLLLSAYYVLKPVREALILAGSGAEIKSYASVGQVLLLALIIPGYSRLVNHFERSKLIRMVTLGFIGCLVLFYFGAKLELSWLGVVFFLWVGIFNLMVVAQFWAYASDLYSRDQGERLFPIVALGASVGAVTGSHITGWLVEILGVAQMLLVGAGFLFLTLGVTKAIEVAFARRADSGKTEKEADEPEADAKKKDSEKTDVDRADAFRLVLKSPYLLSLALLMLLANLVNTTGEFLLGNLVEKHAQTLAGVDTKTWIGNFYSDFFFWVNLAGMGVQLLVAPRLIRFAGIRFALLVLPVVALGGYVTMALLPVLAVVRITKAVENATDYSLQSTVRNALYLPLTVAEKYKAKQVVDTIFVRAGDVLSALVVFVGLRYLKLETSGFAWINAALVGAWLLVALRLGAAYQKKAAENQDHQAAEDEPRPAS